jgi:uncharacterized protein (DUF1330 family)
MKNQFKKVSTALILSTVILAGASSCNKEISKNTNPGSSSPAGTTATSSTIAVAVNASTSAGTAGSTTTDSVYVIHNCERGNHRDSIAAAALSVAIQTYLTTNYAGNIFIKAFAVKDTTGSVKGYVVIVKFNDKPVALQFTADGTFVKVLEQREKGDLDGDGWHRGGRFDTRDGLHRDTIPLTQLPSAITTYFANNYPSDTLTRAFETKEGRILVLSKNNGGSATIFTSAGVFLKRVVLPTPDGSLNNVTQASLPAAILTYLTTTYPNYVFDKADNVIFKGVLKGYLVIINANNTRYGIIFDAVGSFVAVKAIG